MNAVSWLRKRIEEREFSYWLSILYDRDDHSFNNRVYLIYLFLFFSAWIFMVLIFFAQGGAVLLGFINRTDSIRAATFVEILILGSWNLVTLWQALKRSPIVFSEKDAALLCQMPVNHRQVVMRWFFLPWLKSALYILLLTMVIGFSVAEIAMADSLAANTIFTYLVYGFRAWIVILPLHLALFSLQWVLGILRLQNDLKFRWLRWIVILFAILLLVFTLIAAISGKLPVLNYSNMNLLLPVQTAFERSSLAFPLGFNWIAALISLGILFWVSNSISLVRAAQETQEEEILNQAAKYGLTSYAEELKTQHKLGVSHSPSRLLKKEIGDWVLIWKEFIQSKRNWKWSSLFDWFTTISIVVGFPFIPDIGNRIFMIAFWSVRLGMMGVKRLRSDLSCWQIIRQIPISSNRFLFMELFPSFLLSLIISLLGAIFSFFVLKSIDLGFVSLLPGIIAGVMGTAAFDVIRRARSDHLLNGMVPDIGAGGYVLVLVFAVVPVILYTVISGTLKFVFPFLASLALGYFAFEKAVRAYRNIDKM